MTRCALAVRLPASLHSQKVSSCHLHTANGTMAQFKRVNLACLHRQSIRIFCAKQTKQVSCRAVQHAHCNHASHLDCKDFKLALKALKLMSTASRNIVSSHAWNVEIGPQISTYDVDALYSENNDQEGFLNYWGLEDQTVNY